jgi:hypothetical protein
MARRGKSVLDNPSAVRCIAARAAIAAAEDGCA